ncbi:MAG: OmpA family protein [Bacteroidia bacterium]
MNIFRLLIVALGLMILSTACVSRDQYDRVDSQKDSLEWVAAREYKRNKDLQNYIDLMLRGNSNLQRPIVLKHKVPMNAYTWESENPDRVYPAYYLNPPVPDWFTIDFPTSLTVQGYRNQSLFMLESTIYFENNSAKIPADGLKIIQTLALEIRNRQDYLIRVEGYAEKAERWIHPRESDTWTLSMMRAVSVVRSLETAGIPSERLIASGRGEFQASIKPDTTNTVPSNRRVVLYLSPSESLLKAR